MNDITGNVDIHKRTKVKLYLYSHGSVKHIWEVKMLEKT